jgi:hypothetical protein
VDVDEGRGGCDGGPEGGGGRQEFLDVRRPSSKGET